MCLCQRHLGCAALLGVGLLVLLRSVLAQDANETDIGVRTHLQAFLSPERCTASQTLPGAFRHLAYLGIAQSANGDGDSLALNACTPARLNPVVRATITQLFDDRPLGPLASGGPLPGVQVQVVSCDEATTSAPTAASGGAFTSGSGSGDWRPGTALKLPEVSSQTIITNAARAFGTLVPSNSLIWLLELAGQDSSFDYTDILPPLRRKISLGEVGGEFILPLDAPALLMVYRQDVLLAMHKQVPRTWDELAQFVESYDDSRSASAPRAAFCATTGQFCDGLPLFSAIWHSLAQSRGLSQGVYFDPRTMRPLVQTAAFKAAARLFVRLWTRALPQPDGNCSFSNPGLRLGQCAISIGTFEQVKDVARLEPNNAGLADGAGASDAAGGPTAFNSSAFGVGPMPGSTYVLNVKNAAELVMCTAQECPYGDYPVTSGFEAWRGQQQDQGQELELELELGLRRRRGVQESILVNRAPYIPSSLLVAGISSRSTTWQRLLAWHALSHLASPEVSMKLLMQPGAGLSPFRTSHFSASTRAAWADAGYDGALVNRGLDVLQAEIAHPNLAWGLHMAGGLQYRLSLSAFLDQLLSAAAATGNSSNSASSLTTSGRGFEDSLAVLTDQLYLKLVINYSASSAPAAHYNAFLNIRYMPTQMLSQEPKPPGSNGKGRAVGVAVGVTTAGIALLAMAVYLAYRYGFAPLHRKQRVSWCTDAPAVSPKTTLLITDIEGSTKLWEELPEVVMGCALRLHHACLRRALVRYRGYESATEGDSFILAFHKAEEALAFAVEAQQELLEQDWPAELLRNEACAPVYTSAPTGFPFRRPVTLEMVLSRMSMRPHSLTTGGAAPCGASPSTLQMAGLSRTPHSRCSLAQSPTLSQGRLRSSPGPHQRMSIDLGLLSNLSREDTLVLTGRSDAICTSPEADATPLALRPLPQLATAPFTATTTATTTEAVATAGATSAQVAVSMGSSTSARFVTARLGRLEEGEPLTPPPTQRQQLQPSPTRGVTQSPGCDPPEVQGSGALGLQGNHGQTTDMTDQQQQGLTPRRQGGLSLKLQELQEQHHQHLVVMNPQQRFQHQQHSQQQQQQQQLVHLQQYSNLQPQTQQTQLTHPPRFMDEHSVQSIQGSSMNSSGGWAIIHGGETAAMLDDQAGSRAAAASAKHFNELMTPKYVSAPSALLPPTASSSRTPTGSGIAMRAFDGTSGTGPRTAGDTGGEGTGGSEQLFRAFQNGATFRAGGGGRSSQRPSPSRSAGGGGGAGALGRRAASHVHTPPTTTVTSRSPLPQGSGTDGPYVTGGQGAWEVCTLEESLKAAIRGFDENGPSDRKRRLLWRGLRVRMGMHSGVTSESELTYNRASARTVYSGECASVARVVADSAQGGLVLLSEACLDSLASAAGGLHGSAAEALLVNIGRYRVTDAGGDAGTGQDNDPSGAMSLILAIGSDLAARVAVLPPPRKIAAVGLSFYTAPVGRAAMACLNVPDVAVLQEWDEGAARQALALMRRAVLEQLACHRGFLVVEDWEQGSLSAAFAFPLDAVRWALRCREVLSSGAVEWPANLLAHELCREEELPRLHLATATGANSFGGAPSLGTHGSGGGAGPLHPSGSGPLPSPCSGRGRTRTSLELAHALTASCDNTPLWASASVPLSGASPRPALVAPAQTPASTVVGGGTLGSVAESADALQGITDDGDLIVLREPFSTTEEAGLPASYTRCCGQRAGSIAADLDAVGSTRWVTTTVHRPAPIVGAAAVAVAAAGSGSASAVRGSSPTARGNARPGSLPRIGARPLRAVVSHGTIEGGAAVSAALLIGGVTSAAVTASSSACVGGVVDSGPCTGATGASATPKVSGFLSAKFAVVSSRLRVSAGNAPPEGSSGASRTALPASAAAAAATNAGPTNIGPGHGAAPLPPATAASPSVPLHSLYCSAGGGGGGPASAARSTPENARPSSDAASPRPPKGLTVKTTLSWVHGNEMEDTDDGGDIFTLHLGGMDGCGPFGRAPGVSLSGGCTLHGLSEGLAAAAVGASGAGQGTSMTSPRAAVRQAGGLDAADAVVLRGPRIRVGIDCGAVEWGISSAHHCLTYSGGPVTTAEKLASAAAAGQVLVTYGALVELHRMQASLGAPEAVDEAAAELGGKGGFGDGAGALRWRAVVGTPLPPPSGRAGLAASRYRRQQIFSCRLSNDWEDALRECELMVAQQSSAYHTAVSGGGGGGWNSPLSGRLSPFASPWSRPTIARRSKRASATVPTVQAGENRRSTASRRSFDLFGRSSAPFVRRPGALHGLPYAPSAPVGDGSHGNVGAAAAAAAPLTGTLGSYRSHPLPSVQPATGPSTSQPQSECRGGVPSGMGRLGRVYTSAGPRGGDGSAGAVSSAALVWGFHTGQGTGPGGVGVGGCGGGSGGSVPSAHGGASMSAPSNVVPAALLHSLPVPPPPLQQRQQHGPAGSSSGGGGAPPSPQPTYTILPQSLAVEFRRASCISGASWSDAPAPGGGSGGGAAAAATAHSVGRDSPGTPAGTALTSSFPQSITGMFVGSIDEAISLSLRHQLPPDVRRTASRTAMMSGSAAAAGGGLLPLSTTLEYDPERLNEEQEGEDEDEGQADQKALLQQQQQQQRHKVDEAEEFDLTPRTQPRPPPLHDAVSPAASEFASGVVGAVTPANRQLAAGAAAATSSASIGSVLPLIPRAFQGPPYGSTGGASSSGAAGGAGTSGGGSGGSMSASGMLSQALRQHQAHARRQQRHQQAALQHQHPHQHQHQYQRQQQQQPPRQSAIANAAAPMPMPAPASAGPLVAGVDDAAPGAVDLQDTAEPAQEARQPGRQPIAPAAASAPAVGPANPTAHSAAGPMLGSGENHAPSKVLYCSPMPMAKSRKGWPSEVMVAAQQGYIARGKLPRTQPRAGAALSTGKSQLASSDRAAVTPAWGSVNNPGGIISKSPVREIDGGGGRGGSRTDPRERMEQQQGAPDSGRERPSACIPGPLLSLGAATPRGDSPRPGPLLSLGAATPRGDSPRPGKLDLWPQRLDGAFVGEDSEEPAEEEEEALKERTPRAIAATSLEVEEGEEEGEEEDGAALLSGVAVTSLVPNATKAMPPAALLGRRRVHSGAQQRNPRRDDIASAEAADSPFCTALGYRWRPPTTDGGPVGIAAGGSGVGVGGAVAARCAADVGRFGSRIVPWSRSSSLQGPGGSGSGISAASATAAATVAAVAPGGANPRVETGPGRSLNGRPCTAERFSSGQWATQSLGLQLLRSGGTGTGLEVSFGTFLAGDMYESFEYSGVSDDYVDDSRASVRPPAGWRPGVHPPTIGGGGGGAGNGGCCSSAATLGALHPFGRPGSQAARSGSTSVHGHLQSAVVGLVDGSAGAGGTVVSSGGHVGALVSASRGGGGGDGAGSGAVPTTAQPSSGCVVSLACAPSAFCNLDDPDLWRDESYADPFRAKPPADRPQG